MDLDGNGEPEVIYSAYTGGAHCCSIAQVYALNAAANGYDTSARDFFDPGFDVKDVDGDGKREFVTRDAVFAYRFTAYAFSGFPVQLLHWSAGTFTDVTNSFPGTINADVKVWYKRYTRARKRRDGTELGPVSAWAADMYRLGKRKH